MDRLGNPAFEREVGVTDKQDTSLEARSCGSPEGLLFLQTPAKNSPKPETTDC